MSVSPLATESYPASPNNYSGPGYRVGPNKITVHHMVGILSAAQCGAIFQNPNRGGSSHYGIGTGGEIASYVDESCVAWTDSNWSSNCRSVTIETSNDEMNGDWHVSDASLNSLVKLCADIAKRNGMGTLVVGQNLTWHSMYASTTCPGNYLRSKMQYIADEANRINDEGPAPTPPAPEPSSGFAVGDTVLPKEWVDYYGTRLIKTRDFYYIGQLSGDRAVLYADAVNGTCYAAMNTNNLRLLQGENPGDDIKVGDRVLPRNFVDYDGTPLWKTREYYFVSEISGDRAVLRADSMSGPVYAAINTSNLVRV